MEPRPLYPYENMLTGSNMSLAVQLHGSLSQEVLQQSLLQTAKIHPYLGMEIKNTESIPKFQERNPLYFEVVAQTASVTEHSWQDRLVSADNSPQINQFPLTRILLFSDPDASRHDLILVFNHAGIDGIGIFYVLDTLLQFLSKQTKAIGKPRFFQDILGRIPSNAQEILDTTLTTEYLPPLSFPSELQKETPAKIKGAWAEFSAEDTEELRKQCRAHNCTIQSAICTAELIATLNASKEKTTLPQTIVHMVPVNMRPYVEPPLELEDCVCGSSAVLWNQSVAETTGLWEITLDSNTKMKDEIGRKAGLKWWLNVAKGIFIGPPTFMASSIGDTVIQSKYGNLSVTNVKFLGGAYDKALAMNAGLMVHAYTVYNQLNITFAFTSPPIQKEWAEKFLQDMVAVLQILIRSPKDDIEIISILEQLK